MAISLSRNYASRFLIIVPLTLIEGLIYRLSSSLALHPYSLYSFMNEIKFQI